MIDQPRLLAGARGEAQVAELVGIAVGFRDNGSLVAVVSGLAQLGPRQIRELEEELGNILVRLGRGQHTLTH